MIDISEWSHKIIKGTSLAWTVKKMGSRTAVLRYERGKNIGCIGEIESRAEKS